MIRNINDQEFDLASRLIDNQYTMRQLIQDIDNYGNRLGNTETLLRGFEQSYNAMLDVIRTGESPEFQYANGDVVRLTPEEAGEESTKLIVYTLIKIARDGADQLANQLGANMQTLLARVRPMVPPTVQTVEPEVVPDLEDEYGVQDFDEDEYEDEVPEVTPDFDEDEYEDEVPQVVPDFDEDEYDDMYDDEVIEESEEEALQRRREEVRVQAVQRLTTIVDDGADTEPSTFEIRSGDPDYYKDIKPKGQWIQSLGRKSTNTNTGLKVKDAASEANEPIQRYDEIEFTGWWEDEE